VKEKSVKEVADELVMHQQMWPEIHESFLFIYGNFKPP
jgi:hypothetical protein